MAVNKNSQKKNGNSKNQAIKPIISYTSKNKNSQKKNGKSKSVEPIKSNSKHSIMVKPVFVDGKYYDIPINSKGNVEKKSMISRFTSFNDGKKRNPKIDANKMNRTQLNPKKTKPEDIAKWWADPSSCDIPGIDTPGSRDNYYDDVKLSSKAMEKAQSKIPIIGGTKSDRAMIRKTLDDNFSAAELNRITKYREIVVIVDEPGKGLSGYYSHKPKGNYSNDICLMPGVNEDTITHEFVHAIRARDPTRKGLAKSTLPLDGQGYLVLVPSKGELQQMMDKEEATTVAETTIRTRKPTDNPTAYFTLVPGGSGKEIENYRQDRVTLLGMKKTDQYNTVVPKKGTGAVKNLNDRFHKTNISKIKNV